MKLIIHFRNDGIPTKKYIKREELNVNCSIINATSLLKMIPVVRRGPFIVTLHSHFPGHCPTLTSSWFFFLKGEKPTATEKGQDTMMDI